MKYLNNDYVFHRDFYKKYPIITYGQGIYIFDNTGRKYIDASSGAVAVNLGHNIDEIADSMATQAKKVGFVHLLRFETQVLHELSYEIAKLTPDPLNRVFYASGGSEANESAIKFAVQYHYDQGNKEKKLIMGTWQSYHGNTLNALSAGGDLKRRKIFKAILNQSPHVQTAHANDSYKDVLKYIESTRKKIMEIGPENIAAFIIEPIVGSQKGAMVLSKTYLKSIREICDNFNIILIFDEVMTGFGRTGENFATEHYNIVPDILTFGKGVSGGYAPLSGMVVHDYLINGLLKYGEGQFKHSLTYSGHPVSVAAGLAAIRYYHKHSVLNNCKKQSKYLFNELQKLKHTFQSIKEVRGKGMLIGLELVYNRKQNIAFTPESDAANNLNEIAIKNGAIFYPGSRIKRDGTHGEHLMIAPPLTIKKTEIDELIKILHQSFSEFEDLFKTINKKQ